MTRAQLEHIIRAAAATSDVRDIVVIGSQSILGSYPNAPKQMLVSMEADVFPRSDPQRSIVIDGAIGELLTFHETFGYYAHGVDETTAFLPDGWHTRLVKLETPATMGATGWCLEPHDLAVSKLIAGREKDLQYVRTMFAEKMIAKQLLADRLNTTSHLTDLQRTATTARLGSLG